jgi:pentatricopeptide repeat protein
MAAAQGHFRDAISLFLRMRASAAPRSSVPASLPAALKSCAALGLSTLGASLHALAIRSGAFADRFTANALLNLYCKLPCSYLHSTGVTSVDGSGSSAALESVRKVFDEMFERDVVSWNTLVLGCAEEGRHHEALGLVRKMWREGFRPDSFTLSSVLPIFAECADVKRGLEVHGFAVRNGFDIDVFVGSSLIDMYANCTRTDYSVKVFDNLPVRDPILWNSMLAGCAQLRRLLEYFVGCCRLELDLFL